MSRGSCVIDPYGHEVSGTVWDREEIIYAELDMQKVPASRMEHDPCGHYARPDVLDLRVCEKKRFSPRSAGRLALGGCCTGDARS